MKNLILKKIVTFLAVLLLFPLPQILAQEAKPRVAVIPVEIRDRDNIQLNVISDRVTETSGLILRFMNEYEYVKNPPSLSEFDNASLLDYCARVKIDNLVYGRAIQEKDESFTIEMSVFSREKESTTITKTGKAETALDIFDTADRITFSLIEGFSGRHIAFGSVAITLTADQGSFIPVIDMIEYPENTSLFTQVLTGERTIEIRQKRMTETVTIHTEKIMVREGVKSEIALEIPYLIESEKEILSDYDKIIKNNRDKTGKREKVIDAYNKIDSLLADTPYNTALAKLRERYMKERQEWETAAANAPKKEKREFIAGVHAGASLSSLSERYGEDESKNPADLDEINSQNNLSPSGGFFLEIQLLDNIYLQTEYNSKEYVFFKDEGITHSVNVNEFPFLLKYMLKTDAGRFSLLMGAAYRQLSGSGFFDNAMDMSDISNFSLYESGITGIFGFEYSYKINRHILNMGIRLSSTGLTDYTAYDSAEDWYNDYRLDSGTVEVLLGYGYNLGGSGEIATGDNRKKWLFPAAFGLMFFNEGEDENEEENENEDSGSTYPMAMGGALLAITDSFYLGITLFGFQQGGGPLVTFAWTKDPEMFINSCGFIVMPIGGATIAAGMYSISIKRFTVGAIIAGPVSGDDGGDIVYGLLMGYYF